MEIRLATPADVEIISALSMDVQYLHVKALPHLFKPPADEHFAVSVAAERLADPAGYFFIARVNEEDIGCIYARLVNRPENEYTYSRKYIYIDQISVKPAYQGQGCGERLIRAVKDLAKEKNIDTIALDVWSFNTTARAFFAKQGFETFNERLWLRDLE